MNKAPEQSTQTPGEGDATGGSQTPPSTSTQTPPSGGDSFDPAKLEPDQINQILEKNPHIWKTERLAGLRDKASKYDKTVSDKEAAEKKALEDQGKFKELSEKQSDTISELQTKIQEMTVNQALTNKLSPLGVVDLEGALKLIDRSAIEVKEDGTIDGLDKAVDTLKNDKAYLFNESSGKPQVGSPTNPNNGGQTGQPPKFKASQLRGPEGAKFYQENREEILKAQAAGTIEQD